MEFISLMDRIKFLLSTPLQVLTVGPALHSFTIQGREDVADILEFPFGSHNLRKLIVDGSRLGEDSTGLLANIASLYPDLEGLSLEGCSPITSAAYCLIPCLKKLSELNLSYCEVDYVCVKLLETHVCLGNACRRTLLHF